MFRHLSCICTLSYLYCSPKKLTQAKKRWGLSATSPLSAVPASKVVTALYLNVGVLNSNFAQTIGGVYIYGPKFNSSMLCDQPTACSLPLVFKLTRGFSPSTPVSSLTKMDWCQHVARLLYLDFTLLTFSTTCWHFYGINFDLNCYCSPHQL